MRDGEDNGLSHAFASGGRHHLNAVGNGEDGAFVQVGVAVGTDDNAGIAFSESNQSVVCVKS
jgi:hypothetical protein